MDFPGPRLHSIIMARLKYHTMQNFALSVDREHHALITGIRKFESHRRNANYPLPIQRDRSFVVWMSYFLYDG